MWQRTASGSPPRRVESGTFDPLAGPGVTVPLRHRGMQLRVRVELPVLGIARQQASFWIQLGPGARSHEYESRSGGGPASGCAPESGTIVFAQVPVACAQRSGEGDGVGHDQAVERIARPPEVVGNLRAAQPP